ncbi:hypothetical protein ScPMuIL_011049 [Solemya velum]
MENTTAFSPVTMVENTTAFSPVTMVANTTVFPPVTMVPSTYMIPTYWGYICAGVAVLFYGSNFVPVKKFETGDGMFFQWIVCCGIFTVGIILQLILGAPQFYPLVMVGGAVWETGNICVVPIIKTIGLAMGLCMWAMFNLLSGWATGRFGLFGLVAEVPGNVTMNYAGIALACCSAVAFAFMKTEVSINVEGIYQTEETDPLLSSSRGILDRGVGDSLYSSPTNSDVLVFNRRRVSAQFLCIRMNVTSGPNFGERLERMSSTKRRIIGIFLAVFSGLLYGQMFTPAIYIQDHGKDNWGHKSSQNGLDYVFATYCGIFLTSTAYLMIYSMLMRNRPLVYPKAILPGMVSGLMWGIATACWFVSNKTLSEPVAFPIITTGPAVVAALWGLLVFKEIRGVRNYIILLIAFCLVISCGVLAGLSKKTD